jgi:hypothetical protein
MIEMTVSVDTRDLKRALADLGTKAPQAIRRAVNRTARTARTQAVRAVSREIRLPQKDVRPMLPMIPATARHLEAKLVARGRPISLMRLGARQTKLGVVYRGPAGPALIRSAFIATMPRATRPAVWKRRAKPRLPIEKQLGPSVPRLVLEKGIFDAVRRAAQPALAKHLAHEIDYLLSRRETRRG